MGWLHATPEGWKTSRIKQILSGGEEPPMPDPGPAAYILNDFATLGFCRESFSGAAPVTYQEILAWSQLTGITLTAWESITLRLVSMAYCDSLHAGRNVSSFAPYEPEKVVNPVEDVKTRMRSAVKTIKKSR
jgi:hypothetical protein